MDTQTAYSSLFDFDQGDLSQQERDEFLLKYEAQYGPEAAAKLLQNWAGKAPVNKKKGLLQQAALFAGRMGINPYTVPSVGGATLQAGRPL